MYYLINIPVDGRSVGEHERSEYFAAFFLNKVESITRETQVDQNVYNGRRKLTAVIQMFMSMNNIETCMKAIKVKNCEGYDRIPQRVLVDGMMNLLNPLSKHFKSIYSEKKIPEQWRISKIIPVHKKGDISLRLKITDRWRIYAVHLRFLKD